MKQRYSGVIFALLFAAAAAGPINSELFKDSRTCAKRCLGNNKFAYTAKNVYVYSYEAESKTSVVGASKDMALIRIKATVEIEPTSPCDFVMRLKAVSFVDPYVAQNAKITPAEFSRILAKWPLRFSFQDGRVEDLCPMAEDPAWALNVKRGVLSALQNSMKRLDLNQNIVETDVTGECVTKYMVAADGSIVKTKDMVSCKHRHGVHSAVQSIGYDAKSDIQSLAIIKTAFSCTQRINKKMKIISEAICVEKHVFRPFSNGDNGAATVNTQTLRFVETRKGGKVLLGEIKLRDKMLFVHEIAGISRAIAAEKILIKLQEICLIAKEDVRPEQPEFFKELIRAMKMADIAALNGIYKKIRAQLICKENPEKIKKIFHDAIPMIGTSASLQLIRDLIWKREVIGLEKDMWLASLPFIQHPEKEMLSAIRPLLEDKNVEGNTILMVSSLVSGYCAANPKCEQVAEVTEIMDILARFIGKCATKGPYEKTLHALRAIGNIGHSKSIVPRLTQCFTRREIPVQVRLAAIDAFRRIPCDVMRVDLLDLFNDLTEDAELRINAYLALMKCPHKNIVMRIKEALRIEKTNQVGSFVWTHLTNLKETSDPHLQALRAILEDQEMKVAFNKDKRKFSRNYEASFFLNEINAGGKVDSNVIFSPKSFVPRSANLNLTIDLFGRAINFMEMGARMEGVETLLEGYLGSSGYFTSKDPIKGPKYPMKQFDNKYKVDIDALKGFAYMRMFGNELGFWQLEDPNLSIFKNFDIKKFVKNEKFAFHKNMALMDTKLIIPTMVGLPLKLNVAATASLDVEATGKINLASLKNIEIGGSLKPSGAVKVFTEMTVDGIATKAGLRMNTLAHSSTEAKLNFKMTNSKVVESKFELPKKTMEVMTIKSDFLIVKGDVIKQEMMIDDKVIQKNKCTGEGFNKITGMKLCTALRLPNAVHKPNAPFFPLTGPFLMKIELVNHDAPLGFIMKTHLHEPTKFGFIIDTPNSKVNRKISLDIDVNKQAQIIVFDSPWEKVIFNGKFMKTKNTKLISGELVFDHKNKKVEKFSALFQLDFANVKGELKWIPKVAIMAPTKKMLLGGIITSSGKHLVADLKATGFYWKEITFKLSALATKKEYSCISTLRVGAKEFYLKTKVGMLPKGKAVTYTPEILFKAEGKELFKFDSSILYNPQSKIIINVKLDKVFTKIVAFNARVLMNNNKKKMKHQLMINLKAPHVVIDIKGNMELKESKFTSRIITTYKIGKWEDKLTISSKLLDESTKTLSMFSGDLAVESKKDLKNNFMLKGRFGKALHHIETTLDLLVGNPKKNPDKFAFESILNYNFKAVEKVLDYTMTFKRPAKNVDIGFKYKHMNMLAKKSECNMEVKYGTGKTAAAKLHFEMKNTNNIHVLVSVKHLEKELFRLEDKLTSKKPQNYENLLNVILPNGKKIILETTFQMKSIKSFNMGHTLTLPNNLVLKLINRINIEKTNGNMYLEIHAHRAIGKVLHWNPKFTLDYHLDMTPQKLNLFKFNFEAMMSPTEVVKAMYNLRMLGDSLIQDLLITSTFKAFKRIESKYTNKRLPNLYKETFVFKLDHYFNYEEKTTIEFDKEKFNLEYVQKQIAYGKTFDLHMKCGLTKKAITGMIKYTTMHNTLFWDLAVDHLPNKWNIKMAADLMLPAYNIEFHMKTTALFNKDELSFKTDGEFNLKHPKHTIKLTYFARADAHRITFDANFVNPTSRFRTGKLNIDIALVGKWTSIMGKADVDLNGKRLYSLNTGYKCKAMVHNFQLAFLLPNGERITTVFNLGLAGPKTIHVEIKLPHAFGSFELDLDGKAECIAKTCNYMLHLTTNMPHFRNLVANVKHTAMGLIDLDVKFDGFVKNMELAAKIEGKDWKAKKIMAMFKLNGLEKLKLEGNYAFVSIRKINAMFTLTAKIGKTTDKFVFKLAREVLAKGKGKLEMIGMLELLNKKYEVMLLGKDLKEITIKVVAPKLKCEIILTVNKLKWNDFDVMLVIHKDAAVHKLVLLNKHFQEIKISVALATFKKFDLIYKGGINDQKKGNFHLRIDYGNNLIDATTTVNMGNQFELKTNLAFKIMLKKLHVGSAEIKLTHHLDAIFQKIAATFTCDKESITFTSQIKKTDKINLNIRVKSTLKFSATLKAQIKPVTYNTDLSLVLDTKWTGTKKLTYNHLFQKGKSFQLNADLGDGRGKQSDYTLTATVTMKNAYGLLIVLTTHKMAKKYMFDAEFMMNKQMVKGKLHMEAPFLFMAGKPLEITFNKEAAMFASTGTFRMIEYTISLEYTPKRIIAKTYVNWNIHDRASNFNFLLNFVDASNVALMDKRFEMKLIHPVRTVAFATKIVKNTNVLDVDIELSGNVEKGQTIGFHFGKTRGAGYITLTLPGRTYKISGRLNTAPGTKVFIGSFFWNFDKDDSKKIVLTITTIRGKANAVWDMVLKFPSQTKGLRLKTELIWMKGDTLFKTKTEFSWNQDPKNVLIAQAELLKDVNKKYTLMMAVTHPSGLNMMTTIRIFELNHKLTVSVDMKNGNKNINFLAFLDKKNKQMSLKMKIKDYTAEIFGHFIKGGDYEIITKVITGSGKPRELYINLSPSRKNLKMQLNYDDSMPEKSYHIDGNLLTNKMVMVEAFHMNEEDKLTDTRMDLKLDDSNILHGKIAWRPEIVTELNEFLYGQMLRNVQAMRIVMTKVYLALLEEGSLVTDSLHSAYEPEIQSLWVDMSKEWNEIVAEMRHMLKTLGEMYDRDYLYVNTLAKKMTMAFHEIKMKLVKMVSHYEYTIRNALMNYYNMLLHKMEMAKMKFNHVYRETYRKLAYDIEQAKLYVMKKLTMMNQKWVAIRDEYLRKLNDLNRKTYQFVFEHKYTKAILMAFNQKWEELVAFMEKNKMMKPVSDLITYLRKHSKDIILKRDQFIHELKTHQFVNEIFGVVNEIYQRLLWAYKYWDVEVTVRGLDDKVKNYITKTANGIREQIFSLNQMELMSFDLYRGDVEFKLPLVMPKVIVQNQEKIANLMQMMKTTVNKMNQWKPDYNYTLADLYYANKPSLKPADWVPPFKAQASIFKDQHITTFDGVHLDFKGACSYVLARDFVNNHFTVIANFEAFNKNQKIGSIVFHFGTDAIELFHDYMIRFNGRKIDLPIKLDYISVNRIGKAMEIRSTRGYSIIFDPTQGAVIVDISGWYFGKVAGLFGTYNNEQYDDMTLADQLLTTDLEEFAFSWAIEGCKTRQNFAYHERKFHRCGQWFLQATSPFRNCYRQVEPSSFYHVCNTAHIPEIDVCQVALFYIDRCLEKGVPLEMPEQCAMCKTSKGKMIQAGSEIVYSEASGKEDITDSADVVFVVEQRKCNKPIVADLNRLIQGIEQTLRNDGMHDNRYGLVAFGGDNVLPVYSVTIKSKLMASAGLIMDAVKNLEFYDGYGDTDPLKALDLAVKYPFRMATRKTIVLVNCHLFCHEKTTSYQKVLGMLKQHDIAMHLLQKYTFEISGNKSPKTTDLYGIDSKQVYTKSDGGAKEKMFDTIKLPSGDCAELSLASNGSVFDASRMVPSDMSMFVHRFSKRVADSLEKVDCYNCHCGKGEMGLTQSICKRCPSIIPQSSPLYLPGKLFQGNFEINENFKEQLNMYWERFQKKNPMGQDKPAKKAKGKSQRRR